MKTIDSKFKEEVFDYLDELRESGETNMFGSPAYVEAEFDVDRETARSLVSEWMETFPRKKDNPK